MIDDEHIWSLPAGFTWRPWKVAVWNLAVKKGFLLNLIIIVIISVLPRYHHNFSSDLTWSKNHHSHDSHYHFQLLLSRRILCLTLYHKARGIFLIIINFPHHNFLFHSPHSPRHHNSHFLIIIILIILIVSMNMMCRCMAAVKQFYRSVPKKHSLDVAFCLCKWADQYDDYGHHCDRSFVLLL